MVTARALATLDQLWQWAKPLLHPHGELIAMKGQKPETEIAALHAIDTAEVTLHTLETSQCTEAVARHILAVRVA